MSNLGSRGRRFIPMRSSSEESSNGTERIAPLQLESPVGQILYQMLITQPHLFPAAVDQQLRQLESDKNLHNPSSTPSLSLLHGRIAKVKARIALEEILYTIIMKKFIDGGVPMVTAPSHSQVFSKMNDWPSEEDKFHGLHSSGIFEMMKNHMSVILLQGKRYGLQDPNQDNSIARISMSLGVRSQLYTAAVIYAGSIVYGYFLKSVEERFELEKIVSGSSEGTVFPAIGGRFGRLRNYVFEALDAEALERYSTVRSKEAFGITERHIEALYGQPDIGKVGDDEPIKITTSGLKRLILEAEPCNGCL